MTARWHTDEDLEWSDLELDEDQADDEDLTDEDLAEAWAEVYGDAGSWGRRWSWRTQHFANRSHTCSTPECAAEIAAGDLYNREAVLIKDRQRRTAQVLVTKRCCICQ